MTPAASTDYVSRLRAENEELLARVRMLENALAPDIHVPEDWRIWRRHRVILGALLAREIVPMATLCLLLGENQRGEPTSDNNVQQLITRMRDRLGPKGVVIKCNRHVGYSLRDREHWRRQLLKEAA